MQHLYTKRWDPKQQAATGGGHAAGRAAELVLSAPARIWCSTGAAWPALLLSVQNCIIALSQDAASPAAWGHMPCIRC